MSRTPRLIAERPALVVKIDSNAAARPQSGLNEAGGVLVRGTWTRNDRLSAIVLHDAAGTTIPLTPGRTFIELARVATANAIS